MDPTRLMTQTGALTDSTGVITTDDDGNPVEVEATRTVACYLTRLSADEISGLANVTEDDRALYLPPDEPATAHGRIDVDGESFELMGPPQRAFNPRLRRYTHQRVRVRRTA